MTAPSPAARAAARTLAEQLEAMALRLRSGAVPGWAIEVVAPSVRMLKHVIDGAATRMRAATGRSETMHTSGQEGQMDHTTVTRANIETLRETLPRDQDAELTCGCSTWAITYQPGDQRGQITVWPNGRAAVCWGGDSQWGEYHHGTQTITLDDTDADGNPVIIDRDGHTVDNPTPVV